MQKRNQDVGATEFKAKCLQYIDEVHTRKRAEVIITKHGKAVAKLVPVDEPSARPFYGALKGMVEIVGDLTETTEEEWEALK